MNIFREVTGEVDISVVIVTWNARQIVSQCLEALTAHQSRYSFEIILVDNASTDGTPDMVEQRFPQVTLIRNSENLGFAKANNIGIRRATGRYVCLMNSDIIIRDGCFDRLLEYQESHPDVGILAPKLLNPDLSLQRSCKSLPTLWIVLCEALAFDRLFPRSRFWGGRLWEFFDYNSIREAPVIPAAFWMVRREVFDQIGLLDEQFFFYGEDNDFCRRVGDEEFKIVFHPEAEAIHYHQGSSSGTPVRFHVQLQRSTVQYFRKHHGMLQVIAYRAIGVLRHFIRLTGHVLLCFCRKTNRNYLYMKIKINFRVLMFLAGMSRE